MIETFITKIRDVEFNVRLAAWPVLRQTDRAVQVETPGGTLWIPRSFGSEYENKITCLVKTNELEDYILKLARLASTSGDAIVKVAGAGRGPTIKSRKVKLEVQRGEFAPKIRSFTVAKSPLVENEDGLYAPLWLLSKHLEEGETIRGEWPGLDAVRVQLEEIVEQVRAQTAQAELKSAEHQAQREEAVNA